MIKSFLSKIFAVSTEVMDFISDSKANYRRRLLIILPLAAWTSLFAMVNPLFVKWAIDSITESWKNLGAIPLNSVWLVFLTIVLGLGLVQFFDAFFNFIKNRILLRLRKQSESQLEDKFNNFLMKFDGAFLSGDNNLRLIRNLQWNIARTQEKLLDLAQKSTETVFGLGALILILPLIHPLLLILIFISVLVDGWLDYIQNQSWRSYELLENRQSEQKNELNWKIVWFFNKLLENGWISQILNSYRQRREKWINTSISQGNTDQFYGLLKNFSSLILNSVSLGLAGWLFLNGQIPIGTVVVFQLYTSRVKGQLEGVGSIFRWILELRFELFRYDFLLHIKPKLDYTIADKPDLNNIETIEFKNLNFTYPAFYEEEKQYFAEMKKRILGLTKLDAKQDAEIANFTSKFEQTESQNLLNRILTWFKNKLNHQSVSGWRRKNLLKEIKELEEIFEKSGNNQAVIKNLNLKLQKGLIYGIVGYNGAGKTTLTKLLKRTIDPTSGKILVNGLDLKTIDPLYFKTFFASLDQENFLWDALTVKENLLLGLSEQEAEKISDDEIIKVIEEVGLAEKIHSLDLVFGENLELSGGQKQLLEIARVYVQKKQILVLDEGTNQLDAIKEKQVLDLLQKIKHECIVIFITHRMTTTRKCDKVVIMENGEITGFDTPDNLIESKTKNLFQEFWNVQVKV